MNFDTKCTTGLNSKRTKEQLKSPGLTEAGAPEHPIRAQGTICYEFMLMRDPGEVHRTTLDEFQAPGCTNRQSLLQMGWFHHPMPSALLWVSGKAKTVVTKSILLVHKGIPWWCNYTVTYSPLKEKAFPQAFMEKF